MASGKQHAKAADGLIVAGMIAGFSLLPWQLATLATAGLVIGKYANPDRRDIQGKRLHADSIIHRELGCIAGSLWQMYWLPLAWLIPHRHWASHLPGVATIIAWVYLFGPLLALVALALPDYLPLAVIVVCWTLPGWFLQDCVHLALDGWKVRW